MSEINPYESPEIDVTVFAEEASDLSRYSLKELKRFYYVSVTLGVFSVLFLIPTLFIGFISLVSVAYAFAGFELEAIIGIFFILLMNFVMFMAFFGGLRRSRLGQLCMCISAIFLLLLYPIGTIFGVLLLIALMMSFKFFGQDRIKHSDITAAIALREKEGGKT